MSKTKTLTEKLGEIFTPVDSFDNLPTEREVICRYIAIFDAEQKSYHNAEVEKRAISKLAKELCKIWEKHGIFKSQNTVQDTLRKYFIPRFKKVFVKTPPKSQKMIDQKLGEFSEIFMLRTESPAKRIREESPKGAKNS